ncbi:MAG: UDP-N-acetylmuramoyl-L-alanine--D-glutamate ligase [Candidatus Cloacimonetes bacterium]|nr:UDP-N-acetylmuramoyl-L-alanine--D-glutamate ligase [Candidatus Cloacimonadota bacterium]NLO11693.1 UDP-N-acetylmuramoyl-L-alanine--D-glutamate ligase [Candidatus Cloacimonadota bacterium]
MFDASITYGILGLARSGMAAAFKIKELGGKAFLSDLKPRNLVPEADELEAVFDCEFGGHTERLLQCPVWIISPGIPLTASIVQKGYAEGIQIISEIEFGYQIKAKDSKIIAVTGSNGKSTTASLIHHILKGMGYKSILAGNIGAAFCSYPIHRPGIDYIVLEVSSFQLDTIHSFHPDVAVLLNITQDHLDRYPSFQAYASSKLGIFQYQTARDVAIISLDCPMIVDNKADIKAHLLAFSLDPQDKPVDAWKSDQYIYLGTKHRLFIEDLQIKGPHNHANTMAALLSVQALGLDMDAAIKQASSFKSLAHRLEYVATINRVSFYNDSKATNTDSVKSALVSFGKPVRVIMGGSDKGEDFGVLTDMLGKWAQKVYLTGDTKAKMQEAWEGWLPTIAIDDFETAIRTAFAEAQRGDIVLLSPACASFDRFRNFEERGEYFKEIVTRMAKENEKK